MTSRTGLGLTLTVDGASNERLLRGLRAAITRLERAGVAPHRAAAGAFALERYRESGFEPVYEPTEEDYRAAAAWATAKDDAIAACCEGWPVVPIGSSLTFAR
jgi:hypothetical protein